MSESSSPPGAATPLRSSERWKLIGIVVAGTAIGVIASVTTQELNPELSKVFAAGAATLWFAALLGGVVTLLIADLDRGRIARAAQSEYIRNLLTDLKSVYDQVDRGRSLLAAYRSAKAYREVMLGLINARVKLRQVIRATSLDPRGSPVALVKDDVKVMESYLDGLVEEFAAAYKEISREQSRYEAAMAKAGADDLPPNKPWEMIKSLDRMGDFLAPAADEKGDRKKTDYATHFVDHLDSASERLRTALVS